MTHEDIQKQLIRIEGFTEGYKACLQWVSVAIDLEKEKAHESPSPKSN